MHRRDLLKFAGSGIALGTQPFAAHAESFQPSATTVSGWLNVRRFGAKGDGVAVDSIAINRAIEEASASGGATVYFPAGIYLSYSIRLKSSVALVLDQGAVILAGSTPHDGTTTSGYDLAEPQGACEPYQDYGHNHWHNSLLWGEDLHDISITGCGLIWGKGLSRGWDDEKSRPDSRKPGVGNKAIALKNCRNVLLRDFAILEGGWFGILATGVDNLTIDNLVIDTIRDGMDIDCCRNVRVSNCTVNSPYDDAICPKSSFALGVARPTENVTITNCYVTGGYEVGSVLDGTWKRLPPDPHTYNTGRIKLGTESNGGFKNIAISNCVFESCQGFALESEDGAIVEDITFTGITMRDIRTAPFFLRLGARLRGPAGTQVGVMRRIVLSNITCTGSSLLPGILSGIPGHKIEDVKISNVILNQSGGAPASMAALEPPEKEAAYPDPFMFGDLPASGLFARHVRNLDVSHFDIQTREPDARAAVWLHDIDGADFFRLRTPQGAATTFDLREVKNFRSLASPQHEDIKLDVGRDRKI